MAGPLRLALALVAVAIMATAAGAQFASKPVLLQDAATAVGTGVTAHVGGFSSIGVQIALPGSSTPTFVVHFEESINGNHFWATTCHPHNSTSLVQTASGPGFWRCNISNTTLFRARIGSYSGSGGVSAFALMLAGGTLHAASLHVPMEVALQ